MPVWDQTKNLRHVSRQVIIELGEISNCYIFLNTFSVSRAAQQTLLSVKRPKASKQKKWKIELFQEDNKPMLSESLVTEIPLLITMWMVRFKSLVIYL